MEHVCYRTGRDYGKPQVLEISVPGIPNEIDFDEVVTATFKDPVRGIAGTVSLFGVDLRSAISIGQAVLREYDAGRYSPT